MVFDRNIVSISTIAGQTMTRSAMQPVLSQVFPNSVNENEMMKKVDEWWRKNGKNGKNMVYKERGGHSIALNCKVRKNKENQIRERMQKQQKNRLKSERALRDEKRSAFSILHSRRLHIHSYCLFYLQWKNRYLTSYLCSSSHSMANGIDEIYRVCHIPKRIY